MLRNCFASRNSRRLNLLLISLTVYVVTSAQSLSGVWTGVLSNDSINTRKDQTYELALTEYRGKVYGYSYTTFIYDDTLYYIVKRVKGKIEDGVCEVVDDEIVAHNFHRKMDKKVKVTQRFTMNKQDSTWHLDGKWSTNETKDFYALTGGIAMEQEKSFDKSRLLQHLGDLKMDKDLTFYKPEEKVFLKSPLKRTVKKDEPVVAKAQPKKIDGNSGVGALDIKSPEYVKKEEPEVVLNKPVQTAVTAEQKEDIRVAKSDPKKIDTKSNVGALDIKNPEYVKKEEPDVVVNKPVQSAVITAKPDQQQKKDEAIQNRNTVSLTLNTPEYEERKKNVIQTFTYTNDSLMLSLYDNGEVDGDTVSVFINGESLLERQGLKSSAIKKTIYVQGGEFDEFEIILFAENLGKYPPNTGLLIIRDGDQRYEVRFSADFEQSAAIRFQRKKN